MDYYRRDCPGACLDPRRHRVHKYIKDMDTRNKQIFESKDRSLFSEIQANIKDNFRRLVGIKLIGYNKKYADNWEVIFGKK